MNFKKLITLSKKILVGIMIVTAGVSVIGVMHAEAKSVYVRGYTKSNGTYVSPHYRSAPDGNPYNNWSYPGNTNPYTGKTATGNASTYLSNYYDKPLNRSTYSSYVPSYVAPQPAYKRSYVSPYTASYNYNSLGSLSSYTAPKASNAPVISSPYMTPPVSVVPSNAAYDIESVQGWKCYRGYQQSGNTCVSE